MIDRRRFLVSGTIAIAATSFARVSSRSPFAAIEADLGGRVGVMTRNAGNGEEMLYRADERFAMCSVFKWPLAAMVLSWTDRGKASLEQVIRYDATDLLDYSPVTRKHIDEGAMTVAGLCRAAVTVSDNAAANLLLELVGGPAELTAFLRNCGDTVTRLDRYEPDLNTNLPGDERDTTTPRAMLETMGKLLLGDVLSAASRDRLVGWLKDATTGRARLRAGLPDSWTVGDKTGTGDNGAANDIAIAWPPQGKPILIAAFLSGSGAPYAELNAAHERIGEAIAEHRSV